MKRRKFATEFIKVMKKILSLFVAVMATFMPFSVIYADDIVLTLKAEGPVVFPRTGVPITASLDEGIITTETNAYSGTISVTIKDEDGDTVLSTVENVSSNSQFTTNVTSLADGSYTIYYTLDNNSVYYGEFEK